MDEQDARPSGTVSGEANRPLRVASRLFIVAFSTVAVGTLVLGFALGLDGFGGNVLAELGGLALSVLIAITLVEAALARDRAQRWHGVRAATLAALANRVRDLAFDFYLVDSAPNSYVRATAPEDLADAHDELAGHLRQNVGRFAENANDQIATSRELYGQVHADLAFIRDVLAPRLHQLGDDPQLVELLIALEDSEREWRNGIRLIHDDWGFPNELAWEQAANTFAAACKLYRYAALGPGSK